LRTLLILSDLAMRARRSIMAVCSHQIRYQSLANAGRALCFPCDAAGHVPLDDLTDRARENYLFARAVVGRDFAFPVISPSGNAH
jgi:hypothetical protein